ncbi:steroid-binding protein [Acrasis kona]|uniref:Steroid-binding protein n=1 Tax=Acrasis kona TaxID=1008807 RepID=A0AAW2ZN68_9EUKA
MMSSNPDQPNYTDSPIPDKEFTIEDLEKFNGSSDDVPVYLGVNGLVFDVSSKREMYAQGSGYSIFAGKEATRGLAKSSLEAEDLKPYGSTEGLTEKENATLTKWQNFYRGRYPVVGRIKK